MIRAAYVALMRTYHPDRNRDPEAEARAKEIISAFAVLGDRQRRAAYDAHVALERETHEDFRSASPPMRKVGMASVALAVVVSVGFAVWPRAEPGPEPEQRLQLHRAAAAMRKPSVAVAALAVPAAPKVLATAVSAKPPVTPVKDIKPLPSQAAAHVTLAAQPKARTPAVPKPRIVQAALPKAPTPQPMAMAAARIPPAAPPPQAVPGASDRRAQVERIASGFLRQSLEHADAHKQQLLMDTSSRSAKVRAACRSDDCVTGAYLRQIRETTAIVEGLTPTQ